MSDTQDTLIERLRKTLGGIYPGDFRGDNLAVFIASEIEPHIEDETLDDSGTWKQGAIDACDRVLDAIHAHYAVPVATALADSDAKIAELREHSHQRAEDLRTLAAQVAELTQKLERATALVAKFVRCNDEGPGLIDCIDNDGERYTSQFLSDTVREARALNSGASQNG